MFLEGGFFEKGALFQIFLNFLRFLMNFFCHSAPLLDLFKKTTKSSLFDCFESVPFWGGCCPFFGSEAAIFRH